MKHSVLHPKALSLGLMTLLLCVLPQQLRAWDYYIRTNNSHWSTLTPSKPMLGFNVGLGEDDNSGSHPYDDMYHVSLWDIQDPLKIQVDNCAPIDMNDFFKNNTAKLETRYMDYLSQNAKGRVHFYKDNENKWIGSTTTTNGDVVTVGYMWDDGDDDDYYIHVEIYFRNNYPGFRHKVTFSGGWISNGGAPKHVTKIFQDNDIPAIADPFQGTPSYSLAGRKADTVDMQTKFATSANSTVEQFAGVFKEGYSLYIYNTRYQSFDPNAERNNGQFSTPYKSVTLTHPASIGKETTDNFSISGFDPSQSHHIYARIAQDVSNRFNTFYGCKNVANNEARFIRDIGDFWLNCYPKVKDLKLSYDKWTKKVRLTWKAGIADKDHATTKGKWVVFREKGKYCKPGTDSMERIATVRYDVSDGATATYEFEDTGSEKSLDYEALYGYQVCFQADEWNEDISRPVQQLSDTLSVRTERNFAFTDFKVSQQPKSIKLEWTHDKLADAGTSHPYLIDIYRKVGAQGTWERLAQHEVKSAGTKTGSYTDSNLQACDQAKYYLCLQNVMGRNVITDSTHTVASSISDSTRILSFTASRGDFDGSVLLQWKLSIVGTQPVTSQILRRQWGSQDSWELQYSVEDTKATSFSYRDDKAATGTYYEYMLVCSTPCTSSGTASVCTQTFDGFALSSGIMNGRISFGSGTAVEGVRVVLQPNGDNAPALFHSMQTDGLGAGSYMAWQPEGDEVPKLLGNNPWTAQLYVKPEWKQSEMTLGEIGGAARLALVPATAAPEDGTEQGTYHPAVYTNGVAHIADSISVRPDQWQQLSFSINPEAGEWSIALYQGRDTALSSQSGVLDSAAEYKVSDNQVVFANDHTLQAANSLAGLIDEIRLFVGHALSQTEISRLADHRLAGTELDLALYWHLDEGIANQPYAYDYSSTDDMRNSRHGNIKYMATSTDTPPDALFSLSGLTDSEGNYSIHGIPFSGSGSNYSVIPVLGGHEFNPSSVSRYVSASSLVHNGLDFTDVSSFKVTGSVRYDRTDIPVADAQIFVDGIAAIRNGKMIATDAQGAFTVDVPIGNHSISVQKQGHVFCDGGRYPADPNDVDTRHLFDRNISGLEFRDSTLVTVAGRVVGGNREGTKPLGFGESTANIGQAVITLKVDGDKSFNMEKQQDEASVKLVPATSQRTYDPASSPASGEAWTGGATDGSPTPTQYITVKTDSLTGEFAVKLPPLLYKVQNVTTASCTFSDATFADIDASNPLLVYTDTLINPYTQAADSFHYCASFKQTYKSRPQLHIEQLRLDTQDLPWDGHFGDSLYIYREEREGGSGEIDSTYVCLYTSTTDADGNRSVQYTFGHPIFTQLGNYGFSLRAYEEYINKDADPNDRKKWLIDHLPLEGDTVKIANPFSVTTGIDRNSNDYLLDNSDGVIALDSLGYGEYYFAVGFPNLAEPYTWPFTATLYSSDEAYTWEQDGQLSDAVVLGNKPFGADFVLLAPDDLVMVLRDPPGSNSQAKWLEGSSVTTGYTRDDRGVFGGGASSLTKAGFGITEYNGSPFVTVRQKTQSLFDFKIGLSAVATNGSAHSHQTTVTATRTITTGTGQAYDGTCDDVFISNSKNILLGKANDIDVHKKKDTSGKDIFYLDKQEVQTTRDSIKTFFTVTQSYIENELIPSFIKLRDAFLETDSQEPLPYKNRARFISNVPKSSPDFGKSGTYTYLPPADLSASMDTVSYYNGQINKWKEHLAYNERVKVHAIRNRDDFEVENIVVSSGVTQTRTVTNDTLTKNPKFWEASSVITTSNTWATSFNEAGQIGIASFQAGYQGKNEDINNHKSTNTIAYTLSDQDVDDYLSVDVYSNADKYGPVFVTIAGATRCPYEGEVRAKYLTGEDADFVIMNATQDVYEPQLTIQNPIITGVPSGKSALLTLQLYNNSSVDKEGTFSLYTTEATNPHGLRLLMDGKPLEPGLTLRVPANQTTYKTIELLQTDPEITDYDSIALNFGPDCDWWRHFSTGYFSVHYLASGTTVDLAATTGRVNSDSLERKLELQLYNYNLNARQLDRIELQYRRGSENWSVLQTYVKPDDPRLTADPARFAALQPLAGTARLSFNPHLEDAARYIDGNYQFRAETVCLIGGNEVRTPSQVCEVVRDVTRPRIMGTPTPADGVFRPGDDISVSFNEDILKDELAQPGHVSVTAVLNESPVSHDVSMALSPANTAKTDASLLMADRDCTLSAWVLRKGEGAFIHHGDPYKGFTLSFDGEGHLCSTVAGENARTEGTVPEGVWTYVAIAYDRQHARITLSASYDGTTLETAFDNIRPYTESGSLHVGGGLTGQLHGLALWERCLTVPELNVCKGIGKSPFTPGLTGYWPLDEGHGAEGADACRSRHLRLSDPNGWKTATPNFCAELDGTRAAAMPVGETLRGDESYTVEEWFRADPQSGNAALLAFDNGALCVALDGTGAMTLSTKGSEPEAVAGTDYRDGNWHHLALNTRLAAGGASTLYVDGLPVAQLQAQATPPFQTACLLAGARKGADGLLTDFLHGAVDEVRVWKGMRSPELLKAHIYCRERAAAEPSLILYYPFEATELDEGNQPELVPTTADQVPANEGQHLTDEALTLASDRAVGMKAAPIKENVPFDCVADERRIVISLREDDMAARLEGCTVELELNNIRDMNGNYAEPVKWQAYVRRNQLVWEDSFFDTEKKSGYSESFFATIRNEGGTYESWTLSNCPEWLVPDRTSGTLEPQHTQQITFRIPESTPVGHYEGTVVLTGSRGIGERLYVTLNSLGNVPDWKVNPKDYECSMNIIGQLRQDDVISSDTQDIVAAFVGNECRGVASPRYFSRDDAYYVMLTVYGNAPTTGENPEQLTYKVYDASTGAIHPVVNLQPSDAAPSFRPDGIAGSMDEPVVFCPTDTYGQDIQLNKGWTWVSFFINPLSTAVDRTFASNKDKIQIVKDANSTYTPSIAMGDLTTVSLASMYKVKATEPLSDMLSGPLAQTEKVEITVGARIWSWIGYPCFLANSVDAALANLNPEEGDIIKSQSAFSTYTGGTWFGTLEALQPGQGYLYYSQAAADKTFHLATPASRAQAPSTRPEAALYAPFENTMNIMAQATSHGQPAAGITFRLYDESGRLCAISRPDSLEGGTLHFINVGGTQGGRLRITVQSEGDTDERLLPQRISFLPDDVVGTPAQPLLISIDEATAIGHVGRDTDTDAPLFNLQGLRLEAVPAGHGVYIQQGRKVLQ